jgi:hypothetical protein
METVQATTDGLFILTGADLAVHKISAQPDYNRGEM